ncbi:MAG: DEAD/DEAH box helicase [Bacilli bacterium]
MKFKEIGLKEPILTTLEKEGFEIPTPIQEKAIPFILNGKDILGCAQTGTGKTAAFALPLIQKLHEEYKHEEIKTTKLLILTPTRELAMQIRNNIRTYTLGTKLKCSVIFGGVNQASQKEVLKKGVDILVATPGRLLDLSDQKCAKLNKVKYLVLDEADTMLDMGFIVDIKKIVARVSENRQTLLFSATMPTSIKSLAESFLKNPVIVKVDPVSSTVQKIDQEVYYVDRFNKTKLLIDILKNNVIKSVLIFSRTKHGANHLQEDLRKAKIEASIIHGNKSQAARVKALDDFKSGKTKILIATDIAARGLDINDLSHVINYDIPEQAETYVHRIGRTARAGKNGKAISLCSIDEKSDFDAIQKLIKLEVGKNEEHNFPMKIFVKTEKPKLNGGRRSAKKIAETGRPKKLSKDGRPAPTSKPRFSKNSYGKSKFNQKKRG